MTNPSENPPAFPTPGELARVRELATILERFGLFASQDRVTELSSLAPRLADEIERLRAENKELGQFRPGVASQALYDMETERDTLERERDAALAVLATIAEYAQCAMTDDACAGAEPALDQIETTARAALDQARKPLSPENQQSENT